MDRPRRSARQPVKAPTLVAPESSQKAKPKPAQEADPEKTFNMLMESSKSDLVSLDMQDIINSHTWSMLSDDARNQLKAFLPPTAFTNYQASLGSDHPSRKDEDADKMSVDEKHDAGSSQAELNFGFFNDPHFLAATRTFQDHLYLNYFSEAHVAKVGQFEQGIQEGTMAAPWKDEVWYRDNPPPGPSLQDVLSNGRAGEAREVKLGTLAKNKVVRVGDVIAYRRAFATSEVIEKDAIIHSIHPKTFALTMLTRSGPHRDLPQELLTPKPSEPAQPPLSMEITSLSMLETGLLDTDGRMEKSRRPNGNAWKCFTVWRFRPGAEYNPYDSRGGRENHGTMFYLRGSFYHDSH
ncbi:hypothetical protein CVT26_006831 [Gymnopilus dilepis]|uniref:ASX DEUBAD domain-containing protein n=1 Tax=Gymnopilus dilepis TaxID=231916 RepID=A0A409VMX3_9AGAR|nr:hypothetical protein CVT26_006831 [Gymnopilus dilepis]